MSKELLENIKSLTKKELITLLSKITKRVSKEEKMKPYTGRRSPSYCGNKRTPRNRVKGSPAECIRKGVGVGKAQGIISGVNKERDSIYRIIERKTK
jgi:hypothetical protein